MDIDSAMAKVGGWKRWNLFTYVLVGTALSIPLSWNELSIVFVGWEPQHSCVESESGKSQINTTQTETRLSQTWSNMSERNQSHFDLKCYFEKYDNQTGDVSLVKCNKWTFENNGYYTITEEWGLVCDCNYLAELSQTLYQLGSMAGDICSFVVDRYGRKKLHIITHICICIIGMINANSVGFIMFALTKAALGLFVAINITSGTMLLLEFFDAKRRTLPGIFLEHLFTLCYIVLPGLAYSIKSWKTLQMTISLASLILAMLIIPIPESPSWLITRGKTGKADKVLRNIAKWNKVKLDPSISFVSENVKPKDQTVEEQSYVISEMVSFSSGDTKEENGSPGCKTEKEVINDVTIIAPFAYEQKDSSKFRHILDPVILKCLAISGLLWFSNCFMFYGIILASPSLQGDRFLNFVLLGLVEIPSTVVAFFLTKTLGRRLTCSAALFFGGCFVGAIIFIPRSTEAMICLNLAFVILAKGFVSASFAIMVLYTKEVFPTNIRGTCCGVCQVCGRLGSLSAPMTAYMTKTENLFWVPNILFGVVSIIVSFLLLFLPETNNQPLPETVEDCHKLNANKFFSCQNRR